MTAILLQNRLTRAHLMLGQPITDLEATVCYGCKSLAGVLSNLRAAGHTIKASRVAFNDVIRRMEENSGAIVRTPKGLDTSGLELPQWTLTESPSDATDTEGDE